MRVDVLNGVNLDLLGRRDPTVYGSTSLQDLEEMIDGWALALGLEARCRQTNHEGEYVELIHAALGSADALVLNPGAWTHYAWAIRDAAEPFTGPIVEVHISNVDEREEWRRMSVLEGVATHRVVGKGLEGYHEALVLAKGGTA